MTDFQKISAELRAHYSDTFARHGTTGEGVDWGSDPSDHLIRLDRMIAVTDFGSQTTPSILDVGCGYGSLLDRIKEKGLKLDFTGIDIASSMIHSARDRHPDAQWVEGDILDVPQTRKYDYVVCNGILTQKLSASQQEMDAYLRELVTQMFAISRIGVAFNVMTTHVNYQVSNLYYRNPAELLAWCMSQLTSRVRLDHAYPLYEYTLYLYHADAPGLTYGSHRSVTRK